MVENRPLFWGLAYLACIPVFAAIYSSIPSDFYYSNALLEPSYFRDEKLAISLISKSIKNQCDTSKIYIHSETENNNTSAFGECSLNIRELSYKDASVKSTFTISFTVRDNSSNFGDNVFDFHHSENSNDIYVRKFHKFDEKVNFNRDPGRSTYNEWYWGDYAAGWGWSEPSSYYLNVDIEVFIPENNEWFLYNSAVRIQPIQRQNTPLNRAILLNLFGTSRIYTDDGPHFSPNIKLNKRAQNLLVDLFNAQNGNGSEVSGMFSRMLYFSSVTITTLGYGDIVPLTPRARILVASQSILGVVLIGLYLASIGSNIARSRDRE